MNNKIISVHFPKAGGSSLKASFLAAYGQEGVCLDYGDDPLDPVCQYNIDPLGCRQKAAETASHPNVKVIHGHFHPSKYGLMSNVKRITFLRHPIDNLISIYCFWKAMPAPSHAVFDYFIKHNLRLIDLARLPSIRHLMSRTYFGQTDMGIFDFIGFQESYSSDIQMLSKLLAIPIEEKKENINASNSYSIEAQSFKEDDHTMAILQDYLSDDIAFYEMVKRHRPC